MNPDEADSILIIVNPKIEGIVFAHENGRKVVYVSDINKLKWTENFVPPTESYNNKKKK